MLFAEAPELRIEPCRRPCLQAARRKLTTVSGVGVASLAGTVLGMLVTDLSHFLDLSEDTPGP
jgi:hypothetical protein